MPREHDPVQGAPCGKRGNSPVGLIEACEESASRPHLAACRQVWKNITQIRPSMGGVEEYGPLDRSREGPYGFADDDPSHAVSDNVDRRIAPLQFLSECGPFFFKRSAT